MKQHHQHMLEIWNCSSYTNICGQQKENTTYAQEI